MKMTAIDQNLLPTIYPTTPAREIIKAGLDHAGDKVKLACSFSIEDIVVIDLLKRTASNISVFALDTGRLPEETYETAEAICQLYDMQIDWYFPKQESVENLERSKGLFSFRDNIENRQECCAIRKVEPLNRALTGLDGWITGMRRDQSATRTTLQPLERDHLHNDILKINPLTFWSEQETWDYVNKHHLPANRLQRNGYPSIGCAPCTRPVKEGEDSRAGRWWWENSGHKECGLHRR
jgi:phosphoadenosine phosphosulfate reductase